jgi:hypothetical protein
MSSGEDSEYVDPAEWPEETVKNVSTNETEAPRIAGRRGKDIDWEEIGRFEDIRDYRESVILSTKTSLPS